MKSSSEFLQSLITAIRDDCRVKLPDLHAEFDRDFSRLHSALKDRGLSFFTIDLPDAGKHFDKCLSNALLTPFNMAFMRPYKTGSVIPRLFRGLLLRVFHDSGELRARPDTLSIQLLRELYNFLKKLDMECSDDRVFKEVRSFFQIEKELRSPTLYWDEDRIEHQRFDHLSFHDSGHVDVLPLLHYGLTDPNEGSGFPCNQGGLVATFESVCDITASLLGTFNGSEYRAKHGPGAVSDLRHDSSKYEFPSWPEKLENQFPLSEFAFANYGLWVDSLNDGDHDRFSLHEPPAKLIAVPKTQKGPRLIASEPTSHQWIQQLTRRWLIDSLASTPIAGSIKINDQTVNQRRACEASLGSGHATVDLSSASDRLSCWVVERAFRKNPSVIHTLHASRTRWLKNTIDKKSPEFVKLKKFACQGSALTFPVQSIIYACAAIACVLYRTTTRPSIVSIRSASKSVQVFGDDTIIPEDCLELYQELLHYLGFKVNASKTYGIGKFRESCGHEYFDGTLVTPTYFRKVPEKARPESIISAIEVSNGFYAAGYRTVAALIKSTVQRLLPKNSVPFVTMGSGSLGWRRHVAEPDSNPKKRFDKALQCMTYRIACLTTRTTVTPDRGSSSILQYFTEEPAPDTVWKAGVRTRPKLNLRFRWEARSDLLLS